MAKREAREIDGSFTRSRVAAECLNEMKRKMVEYSDQKVAERKRRKTQPATLAEPSPSLEAEQQAEGAAAAARLAASQKKWTVPPGTGET